MREQLSKRLTICNTHMFNRVMSDEEICAGFIKTVLGIEISGLEYINIEKAIEPSIDARGVRLDVYAKADGRAIDIEMQARPELFMGKRFRYYQSAIDTDLLGKGEPYDYLSESYIVFLCRNDPFGQGLPVYHLDRMCREDAFCEVGDESHWVVLNSSAWETLSFSPLRSLLEYVQTGYCDGDALVDQIDEAVEKANDDARWVRKVLSVNTVEQNARWSVEMAKRYYREVGVKEGREIGIAEGLAEGRAEGVAEGISCGRKETRDLDDKLIRMLFEAERQEDVLRMASDAGYRDKLIEEFELA